MFDLSRSEREAIDQNLVDKLSWAQNRNPIGEQLALDASRMLSCLDDRLNDYVDQGFFKRCWFSLSGKTGSLERVNQHDLIEMQKYSWRYIDLLQERDLLAADSIVAVKNNLLSLSFEHENIKSEVTRLAERVYDRFVALEDRVNNIEASQNIHGWLLTISTCDYDDRFPKYFRMLRVISDFYLLKPDMWNVMELRYMHKALDEVGLNSKEMVSVSDFIDTLVDEIQMHGHESFSVLTAPYKEGFYDNDFIVDSISAPSFSSMFQIRSSYTISSKVIKSLQKNMNVDFPGAIKSILRDFIDERGVDVSAKVSMRDLATEILSCFSLARRLASETTVNSGKTNLNSGSDNRPDILATQNDGKKHNNPEACGQVFGDSEICHDCSELFSCAKNQCETMKAEYENMPLISEDPEYKEMFESLKSGEFDKMYDEYKKIAKSPGKIIGNVFKGIFRKD